MTAKKLTIRWAIFSTFLSLLVLGFTHPVYAFPELVKHGYTNCTSCHVSPTGGGVLTPYGRGLSKEVLSQFGKEGEESFAFGLVKTPDWLNAGGDFRELGLYQENATVRAGRTIFMQADLEAAVTAKNFTVDATLGYLDTQSPQPAIQHVISRRHYALYRPIETLSFRGGRFQPAYGINVPDHQIFARRGLAFEDEGMESYNLEAAWIGERFNSYVTAVFGRPDNKSLNRETGVALSNSLGIADNYKVGLSYFYGVNTTQNRHLMGPFGILGFTPKFSLLSEFDFQGASVGPDYATRTWGIVDYQKLDYEYFQGFHGFLVQQLSRPNFSNGSTLMKSYGIGLQYFPRPHFEISATWEIQTIATSSDYSDYAYLMLHFYP